MKCLLAGALAVGAIAVAVDANAGCGFYTAPITASASAGALVNDADQVSLVRDGTRFALTMSTNYKGPAEDFAMVVPVPVVLKKEQVKTLAPAIFTHLETLTAPRIVEYEEIDPCEHEKEGSGAMKTGAAPGAAAGGGGGGGKGGYGVVVEAQFISGEYEIVVLSAAESDGLERWLKDNKYNIPDGASTALDPYVKQQQKFVVAKVDSKKVKRDANGAVVLSPLRFVYETQDFRLPVRLGLLNAPKGGKQDVIIYLLSRGSRMESANLANATIPTNVDVQPETVAAFPAFYAALFDATLAHNKGATAVLEYAWTGDGCGSPCTSTPLTADEISRLGGDEVFTGQKWQPSDVVLTRLHTRYDAETLKEDIVFRTAEAMSGGREGDPGAEPTTGPTNAFQARFTVRHAWEGPIECKSPKRGSWRPRASHQAIDLASPKRDVQLAAHVVSPIPALGITGTSSGFGQLPERAPKRKEKDLNDAPPQQITRAVIITAAILAALMIAILISKRRKPDA
jgi:hypothetical protein